MRSLPPYPAWQFCAWGFVTVRHVFAYIKRTGSPGSLRLSNQPIATRRSKPEIVASVLLFLTWRKVLSYKSRIMLSNKLGIASLVALAVTYGLAFPLADNKEPLDRKSDIASQELTSRSFDLHLRGAKSDDDDDGVVTCTAKQYCPCQSR